MSSPEPVFSTTNAQTGRNLRQITAGPGMHYPLYYFIPSMTADGRFLVVHEQTGQDVQLVRVDFQTGRRDGMTRGRTAEAGWHIWCDGSTTGIYNHCSALNLSTGEVWWFEDAAGEPGLLELHACEVDTLSTRRVAALPGRTPIGQNAFSPDGARFAFIHADHETYRAGLAKRNNVNWDQCHEPWRRQTPCTIGLVETATGMVGDLISLPFHVHHVIFLDADHLLVNHAPTGNGMWVMNIHAGASSIRELRPPDERGRVCHQVVTARGIDYEVFAQFDGRHANFVGRHAWPGAHWLEVPLGATGYAHTGFDPEGRLCFYEVSGENHALVALLHPADQHRRELRLLRVLPPCPGPGQRFHAHPFLSPDRRWMIFTEVVQGASQIFALDVADLSARGDIGWPDPLPAPAGKDH